MPKLTEKLKNLPKKPGVYIFKNKKAQVLYIGKAKSLRDRVRQYFGKGDERPQIPFLMKEIEDFDYTVVNTELESLYLERTLIQKHTPKYNIELRDDKSYAFVVIDYSSEIPQITTSRKYQEPSASGAQAQAGKNQTNAKLQASSYFGPYTSSKKIRDTLHLVRKIFSYCSAKKTGNKPCFHFHLHRCPGVCIGKISITDYKKQLNKIALFLSGDISKTKSEIKKEMTKASKSKKFEAAARLRDQLRALEILEQKQNVIFPKKITWDIVSLAESNGYACMNLFKIREGKLLGKENFVYSDPDLRMSSESADAYGYLLQNFLEEYYLSASDVPKAVYIESEIENERLVTSLLKKRAGKKVELIIPQKGKAAKLIALGKINAEEYLKNYLNERAGHLDKINEALGELKKTLKLSKIPKRIEGYDISNTAGTNPVGSMVVFKDGLPAKNEYRKFKVQTKNTPDDFAMMREMISRRISRSSKNQDPRTKDAWPLPDLMVIDGGKGQLTAALGVLQATSYKLQTVPTIGLAKRLEEIFVPGESKPIILGKDNPALQLLQRLRDEAHRFGITFHRKLRSKQAVRSKLDEIPGIGPKTKKLLKQKLGTIAAIKKTDITELAKIVGKAKAQTIKKSL